MNRLTYRAFWNWSHFLISTYIYALIPYDNYVEPIAFFKTHNDRIFFPKSIYTTSIFSLELVFFFQFLIIFFQLVIIISSFAIRFLTIMVLSFLNLGSVIMNLYLWPKFHFLGQIAIELTKKTSKPTASNTINLLWAIPF